jgi:hypothetical protein
MNLRYWRTSSCMTVNVVTPENGGRIDIVLISRTVEFHRRHSLVLVRIHVSAKPRLSIPFAVRFDNCALLSERDDDREQVLCYQELLGSYSQCEGVVVHYADWLHSCCIDCGILWSLPGNFLLAAFFSVEGNGSVEKILFE